MMTSHVKRWLASFGDHQVCSKARRTRLHHQAPATVCRLVCVVRPLLPRAPLLRRHYPPSLLLRAHAHVLWPPCPFDLSLVGAGLRRLCHPRLVHWTVLALTVWLRPKVSCPVRRVLARCIRSFSSQATSAFATDGWLGALPVPPQATSRGTQISALQAFSSITTLSFTCPPGRSHAVTRGEGFVARACLEFVSSSQVEPVIRLNRPITGAGSAPASHRVLLAARRDRTQALCRWAAGSCRNRLLFGLRRCLIPRLDQFPTSPRFIPDGGISPVRLGTAAFPLEPSHDDQPR